MEMWNGKRYSLEHVKQLGFDRVAERKAFKADIQNLDSFDGVLMLEFKNDIRNQKMYVFKNGKRYKVDDPNDLFDLKAAFRDAINLPLILALCFNQHIKQYWLPMRIISPKP